MGASYKCARVVEGPTWGSEDEQAQTAENADGLTPKKVPDIAANQGESYIARRKSLGGFKCRAAVDDLEPHRRVRRNQPACNGRHCTGSLTVDRAHRHAERYRTSIVPIGKQACT